MKQLFFIEDDHDVWCVLPLQAGLATWQRLP